MSFASDARRELTKQPAGDRRLAACELSAALSALGAVSFRGMNRYAISFTVDSAPIIRYFFSLIKRHFGVVCEIRTIRTSQLGHRLRYRLMVPDADCLGLLRALDMLDPDGLFGLRAAPSEAMLADDACMDAFLRGAFMVCGSVTNPERAYHMEFSPASEAVALFIMKILRKYEFNVNVTSRKGQYVVYLKDSERIADALTRLGAQRARLQMEDVRIKKDLINLVNRQMNCDARNIQRTVESSSAQLRDIAYIRDEMGLDKLPPSLRDVAQARLENPSVSLAALGERLNPPIGKSGVNNRMRRLSAIAERLRAGDAADR